MAKSDKTYEQLKHELDVVMGKLRHEDTSIDDALELHKESKRLIVELEKYLGEVNKKVEPEDTK